MNANLVFSIAPGGALLALLFAVFLIHRVVSIPLTDEPILKVQQAIASGSRAFIRGQYSIVAGFFGCAFLVLLALALLGYLPRPVPFVFLTGGFFSGVAGLIGLRIATAANGRTCAAARNGLNQGLRVAFSSGAVMGFTVVGLGLLGVSVWYVLLNGLYAALPSAERLQKVTTTLLSFGMGASLQALFARVGGGIFTKAADVGADIVGKVEAGIPEDDARNPAVIADNVGDNVGDVAGMGADLYESYVGALVATMVLAASAGLGVQGAVLPIALAGGGVLASVVGFWAVRTGEKTSPMQLLGALRGAVWVSSLGVALVSWFIVRWVLGPGREGIYFAVLSGLAAGVLIGLATEYFTADCFKPVRRVAESARTGTATVVISGLGVGMLSTFAPVLVVVAAIWIAFTAAGGAADFKAGLYGVGLAAVGMLSTLGVTLATDAYGPVADNAGGIAQMSGQDKEVRERTDLLDSLGNTTAATGKGFAIGSAALTAMTLISAYHADIELRGFTVDLSILNPKILAGLFIGAMLPFLFSALCLEAVGKAAMSIVEEVRRQFREIPGLLEGRGQADYGRCVAICTRASLREMVLPALTAVIAPLAAGFVFGAEGVMGLLAGSLVCGFVLAIFMANAGGVWDNAKKYIEAGFGGGKGSEVHKAAVVGDTVGDPLKDTAGPSLNILIKLMSMVSVVFAGFVASHTLLK